MKSLVVLMMEEEQPEGLSARKLVAETVKHNVLTAYSAETGLALLRRFPRIDVVLLHAGLLEKRENLVNEARALAPDVPIILATPLARPRPDGVDYMIDSHRPQDLLRVLEKEIAPRA